MSTTNFHIAPLTPQIMPTKLLRLDYVIESIQKQPTPPTNYDHLLLCIDDFPHIKQMAATKNGWMDKNKAFNFYDETVFEHSVMSVWYLNQLLKDNNIMMSAEQRLQYMVAMLIHDIGKTCFTEYEVCPENLTKHGYKGHSARGIPATITFAKEAEILDDILIFWVEHHSQIHGIFNHKSLQKQFLADCKLHEIDLFILLLMAKADLMAHKTPYPLEKKYDNDNLKNLAQKIYDL